MINCVGLVTLFFCVVYCSCTCTERDKLLFFYVCPEKNRGDFSLFLNTTLSHTLTLLAESQEKENLGECLAQCKRQSNCLALDVKKTSNGVICRYSDIQPMSLADVLCGEGLLYIKGDVSSLPILPDVRLPNFTLNFDQDIPMYGSHNAIFDIASGFIGIGANMTGTPSFMELNATIANQCPLTSHLCPGHAVTHTFWAKLLTRTGNWHNHFMPNNLIRFRETTSNSIQYHNWDLLDGNNQQKYEFAMLDFDMFDQWVHFVVTFKPDGTNDALHFYLNGAKMNIDVAVGTLQNGTRAVNRLVFGTSNLAQYNSENVARWYFDELYAWDVVLSDEEVWSWYINWKIFNPEDNRL